MHSYIQQIFIELLICAMTMLVPSNTVKTIINPHSQNICSLI